MDTRSVGPSGAGPGSLEDRIRAALAGNGKVGLAAPGLVRSAVLMPLYEKGGEYYTLFTRRTENLSSHKGQVSFPGGHCHHDELALATALRESHEEIGLRPEDVQVLGELEDVVTLTTNFLISPFVGLIPHPYPFKPSQREVAELIEVPLSALRDHTCYKVAEPAGDSKLDWLARFYEGKSSMAWFYEYRSHVIWGATARIVKGFLDRVFGEETH